MLEVKPMPRRKITYQEGDWITLPLKGGGYGLGIVARVGKGGVILGYFFAPRYPKLPTAQDTKGLSASDAILIARFGDLGLLRDEWHVVCHAENWKREEWLMPEFGRIDRVETSTGYRTLYHEDRLTEIVQCVKVSAYEAVQLPHDALCGYMALAIHLNRLLL